MPAPRRDLRPLGALAVTLVVVLLLSLRWPWVAWVALFVVLVAFARGATYVLGARAAMRDPEQEKEAGEKAGGG